jgi:hypothetical protein
MSSDPRQVVRRRLPNRRPCETLEFEHWGVRLTANIGFDNGQLSEAFLIGAKVGTHVAISVQEASIIFSILLQCEYPAEAIRHAVPRNSDGTAAGPIGKLLDLLAKERAP